MVKQITLALSRHGGTETPGNGEASPGTRLLFTSLESCLAPHFSIVRVPSYYPLDARGSLRVAADVLGAVDTCLLSLPRDPADLDAFFVVRRHLQRQLPFIYMPLGEFPRGAMFYRHLYRRLGPQDAIVFSSSADRAVFQRIVAATPVRNAVVPLGIGAERFAMARPNRASVRNHLGMTDDDVVFVYHGRITMEKNVHDVVAIIRQVAEHYPQARLWVLGSLAGQHTGSPRALAAVAGTQHGRALANALGPDRFSHRVSFWGEVSQQELPNVLAAADIAVNFSLNGDENFGYSAVEAMAAGLPVIASDWGGHKDTIEHGVTGYRVPTVVTRYGVVIDRWKAMRYTCRLVRDVEQRRAMGERGIRRAAKLYTSCKFGRTLADYVKQQIEAGAQTRTAGHRWTALGRRLERKYSARVSVGPFPSMPTSVEPAALPFTQDPLMRGVLAPYATTLQRTSAAPTSVLFLPADICVLDESRLVLCDPRYPLEVDLDNEDEREIVRKLLTFRFVKAAKMKNELSERMTPGEFDHALMRLMRMGIVVASHADDTLDISDDSRMRESCERDSAYAG